MRKGPESVYDQWNLKAWEEKKMYISKVSTALILSCLRVHWWYISPYVNNYYEN